MVYSESLAERIRWEVNERPAVAEKKMFGGLGFLVNGNMFVGVWKCSLIVRIGPENYASALQEEFVGEFDVTGRPMTGWVVVAPDGLDSNAQLVAWIDRALEFVETLPPK